MRNFLQSVDLAEEQKGGSGNDSSSMMRLPIQEIDQRASSQLSSAELPEQMLHPTDEKPKSAMAKKYGGLLGVNSSQVKQQKGMTESKL